MTTTGGEECHPLARVLATLGADVTEAQLVSRVGLRPAEAGQALLDVTRLQARIESLIRDPHYDSTVHPDNQITFTRRT